MAPGRTSGHTRTLPDPITVVIADDHRSFGEALQIALDKERDLSVVRVVDGGDDAVRTAIDDEPDVVLMDLKMPDLDGIEATREILRRDPNATIIMCSALGQEALVIESIAAGARDFIVKPFTPEKVIRVVDNLTRR